MSDGPKQMYERVLNTIREYALIEKGEQVLVGVSGGADSMVLLYILHRLRKRLDLRLHVAHLNHRLRGAEAERDAEFVRCFSEQLGIPCTIESRNVPEHIRKSKLSPQDAARQVRYQFFEALGKQIGAQKIATAHHADDQAETFLLALIRGAGIHGLGGIQPISKGNIIRPLLSVTRDQVEAYARTEGLQWVVDSSNACRKYVRNGIRLDLLPLLQQQFNPAIVKRLTEYAQLFREDAFFIDKIARKQYNQICKREHESIKIHLEGFAQQDCTIQRAIIYKAFQELTGARHQLETCHVRAVLNLFTKKDTGKRLSLPKHLSAVRSYEWGVLQCADVLKPDKFSKTCQVALAIPGRMKFADVDIETNLAQPCTPDSCLGENKQSQAMLVQPVDYDSVFPPVMARFRRAGDCFRPLGMHGKKTLKKFFIDRKVPRHKRNRIPLCADRDGIIWVMGYNIDDRVKVTQHTKNILTFRVYEQVKSEK